MRELLRKYRGDRTQAEMAAMYGTTQQTWHRWEQGENRPPLSIMEKIAESAGFSVKDIFFGKVNTIKLFNKQNFTLIEKEVS